VLTEAGQIALTYADEIFRAGTQMIATLGRGRRSEQLLRIGAVATLSRNFQESFVKPLLMRPDVRLSLEAGLLVGLLHRLEQHELDLVLSNRAPPRGTDTTLRSRRIARQQVSIVGPRRAVRFRFPDDIDGARMLLPGRETDFRAEFDAMCEQLGVRPHVLAEVDDMATMRLLARDIRALALVPRVVVRDELRARALHEQCAVPGLFETFYAVTAERMFQHPLVTMSLARTEDDLLETVPPRHRPTR
jgi:LysR family transcriptional activator of nhaA